MEDELIDIVTKDQKPTGQSVLKSEVHKKGFYHNTVHVWFYTHEGDILLAQRAANKIIRPLLWDVSVAGHVDAGETVEEAAVREIKEEIGLTILESDLQKIGIFPCFQSYDNGIIDNEFHHTFIVEFKNTIYNLIPQENEVEALKLVSMYDFHELLDYSATNNHFVETNKVYYHTVIDFILEQIT